MSPRAVYRAVSIAETVTWALLIAALVTRATTGFALVVTLAGGIHGFVFLAYAATALLIAVNQRWNPALAVAAVATAVVPFATIPFDLWLERRGRLDGGWRTQKSDDPRDNSWFDSLVRWMLRHPLLLGGIVVAAVAIVFVVLLVAGTPGS